MGRLSGECRLTHLTGVDLDLNGDGFLTPADNGLGSPITFGNVPNNGMSMLVGATEIVFKGVGWNLDKDAFI